jgi:A/G-specific adenine glycosylase
VCAFGIGREARSVTTELDHDAVWVDVIQRVTPAVVDVHERRDAVVGHARTGIVLARLVGLEREVVHPCRCAGGGTEIGLPTVRFPDAVEVEERERRTVTEVEEHVPEEVLDAIDLAAIQLGVYERKPKRFVEAHRFLEIPAGIGDVMESRHALSLHPTSWTLHAQLAMQRRSDELENVHVRSPRRRVCYTSFVPTSDEFRQLLMPWAQRVRRDLPWRRTRDPWAILVAEVMLQQTQVSRVIPKWEAFLRRFPTAESCALASPADIVRLWEGLGYHRRALALHGTALAITEQHHGMVPCDRAELMALPGIGPYTSRAIRTFAYELDDAVLDTNVARIVARAIAGKRCTPSQAQTHADSLVPSGHGWAWNQGMLDLGATVCTKQRPNCPSCPVAVACMWHRAGHPDPDPALGSAGVSGRQSRFEGSDRQGRGRILAALRSGPVDSSDLARLTGWRDRERADRAAESLVADGLAVRRGTRVHLVGDRA